MDTKTCNKCKIEKPLDQFNFKNRARGYLNTQCKLCVSKRRELRPVHIAPADGEKKCRGCGEVKNINKFATARRNKDGKEHFCKQCRWNQKDKEKHNLSVRASLLYREYGLTLDEYDTMLLKQNFVCAICKNKDKQRLCVDHNHKTKKVRGLLCSSCNRSLGALGDTIESIEGVLEYLIQNDARA